MRGNISSVFMREWPEPKTCTRPSAAMVSAKMVLASSMAGVWVLDTCSSTSRAAASQRSEAVNVFSFF